MNASDYSWELFKLALRRDFVPYGPEHASLLRLRAEAERAELARVYATIRQLPPKHLLPTHPEV